MYDPQRSALWCCKRLYASLKLQLVNNIVNPVESDSARITMYLTYSNSQTQIQISAFGSTTIEFSLYSFPLKSVTGKVITILKAPMRFGYNMYDPQRSASTFVSIPEMVKPLMPTPTIRKTRTAVLFESTARPSMARPSKPKPMKIKYMF